MSTSTPEVVAGSFVVIVIAESRKFVFVESACLAVSEAVPVITGSPRLAQELSLGLISVSSWMHSNVRTPPPDIGQEREFVNVLLFILYPPQSISVSEETWVKSAIGVIYVDLIKIPETSK